MRGRQLGDRVGPWTRWQTRAPATPGGELLRKARLEAGVTLRELAQRSGLSKSRIVRLELEERLAQQSDRRRLVACLPALEALWPANKFGCVELDKLQRPAAASDQ